MSNFFLQNKGRRVLQEKKRERLIMREREREERGRVI